MGKDKRSQDHVSRTTRRAKAEVPTPAKAKRGLTSRARRVAAKAVGGERAPADPRRRLPAAERRALIIAKAGDLFAQRGMHGVTTKDIAAAAGVTEPVLYRHFASKEEIYRALESLCHVQHVHFRRVIAQSPTNVRGLVVLTYMMVAAVAMAHETAQPFGTPSHVSTTLVRLMGFSFLEDGRFASAVVASCLGQIYDQWTSMRAAAIRDGDASGDPGDEMPLRLAYQAMVGVRLFDLPGRAHFPRYPEDSRVRLRALTLFALRGLGVKESALADIDWDELSRLYTAEPGPGAC